MNCKLIKLNQRRFKNRYVIVDQEDYERVNKYMWRLFKQEHREYAFRTTKATGRILLHRFILNLNTHDPDVDHKNRNGLDNRKNNLRLCNDCLNHGNSRKHKNGITSRHKGVFFNKRRNRWVAQIRCNGQRHVRSFKFEDEAALEYNKKALEYFGEFAYKNKVNEKTLAGRTR